MSTEKKGFREAPPDINLCVTGQPEKGGSGVAAVKGQGGSSENCGRGRIAKKRERKEKRDPG